MPLPTDFQTVDVYGHYVNLDGTPAQGTITFAADQLLHSASTQTAVLPGSVQTKLDATGEFTIQLPATDDPDITPSGWAYKVTIKLGSYQQVFRMLAPLGDPIDLLTVAPAEPDTPQYEQTVRSVNSVQPNTDGAVYLTDEDIPGVPPAIAAFSASGQLTVRSGQHRWYNDTGQDRQVQTVRAAVGTAPAGSGLVVDLLRNGTSLATVTVPDGSTTATATPAATIAAGDYLTVDITQIGATVPGSDLTVTAVIA